MLRASAYGLAGLLAACLIPDVAGRPPAANVWPAVAEPTGESCYAGKDLVVQALERLSVDHGSLPLQDANELLKRATDLCSESGEAWYYRSLVETKLNNSPQAAYAMRQAVRFPSDALTQKLNPFVLATPDGNQAPPPGPIQQRWALVVGIGSFEDKNVDPLRYTVADAKAFQAFLVDPKGGGFPAEQVKLLTDGEATLRGIKESLNWLARSAKADDLVVVYVASHGSARELDTADANYIVTHDTQGAGTNQDQLYATALPMVELANDVATRLKSLRTAVFLDTCYSGGAFEHKAPGPVASVSHATLERISQGTGRIIFAASSSDQRSLESSVLGHGYFTYFLVQALRQNPAQPLSGIYTRLQQQVATQVAKDYAIYGLHQDPVMSRSSEQTNFALGSGGVAPAGAGGR